MITNSAKAHLYHRYNMGEEWAELILDKINHGEFLLTQKPTNVITCYVYLELADRLIGAIYSPDTNTLIDVWFVNKAHSNKNFSKHYTRKYLKGILSQKDIFASIKRNFSLINRKPLSTSAKIAREKIRGINSLYEQINLTNSYMKEYYNGSGR